MVDDIDFEEIEYLLDHATSDEAASLAADLLDEVVDDYAGLSISEIRDLNPSVERPSITHDITLGREGDIQLSVDIPYGRSHDEEIMGEIESELLAMGFDFGTALDAEGNRIDMGFDQWYEEAVGY